MATPVDSATYKNRVSLVSNSMKGNKDISELGKLLGEEFKLSYLPGSYYGHMEMKDNGNAFDLQFGAEKYGLLTGKVFSSDSGKIKWILTGSRIFNGSGEHSASINWENGNVYVRNGNIIGKFTKNWAPSGSIETYNLQDIGGKFYRVYSWDDIEDVNLLVNDAGKIQYILPKDFITKNNKPDSLK